MSERHETEFKLQLAGAADVAGLVRTLSGGGALPSSTSTQTNHFFDTPEGRLASARCSLRLREEDAHWTITAKGPAHARPDGTGLTTRPEEECEVDAEAAQRILAGEESPLAPLRDQARAEVPALVAHVCELVADRPLDYEGCFENERTRVGPTLLDATGTQVELLFEFDRTRFPSGRVEWEVEVEVEEARAADAQAALRALFRRARIEWKASRNKVERFREDRSRET